MAEGEGRGHSRLFGLLVRWNKSVSGRSKCSEEEEEKKEKNEKKEKKEKTREKGKSAAAAV